MDFIRGAALGIDGLGKPIIAMTSVTQDGESKIVPDLKIGNIFYNTCILQLAEVCEKLVGGTRSLRSPWQLHLCSLCI